ncbi:RNA-directed DNA polymerase from mobile element jockey-like isoform X1 [Rhizophagus irregularis DAOM 181602=DAOM 197198]|nr:RNA-directed DNA polymerase from mobile element jockey-like isoform X1 [Rhizophagus irregularis DAOM 181602=DAOM 197198]
MMNDNIDYDTFVRNPPTPLILVIFLMILYLILYFLPLPLLLPYSFNISSFNVNGLKTPGQGSFKMDQISSFFLQNHISFGGIVDTHLSPKQMKFLSKRVCDYTSFHSDLDSTKHGRSSGGVSLFIHNSLATHVQFYQSHSSRILFVDLLHFLNLSGTLGTYHHLDTITRIDFVWSCPLLRQYILTASIFDAHDLHISDHNPIITYFDVSLLSDAIKSARARQLGRNTQRGFKYDSISTEQWTVFADDLDILCPIDPLIFDAWPLNQKCEYLHSRIIKAANSTLPSVTVGNTYVPKKPKDLDSLCQSYRFLSKVAKTIRSLHKTPISYSMHYETKWSSYYIRLNNILSLYKQTFVTPITFPPFLRDARIDDFANLLQTLENMTLLLRSLLLLKEKEFQAFFIQAKIDARNDNFTNDISTFIESALSRTRRQIVLDRVFIDHPTHPTLLTSPDAIDQEVNEHFQNFVPITSTPPSSIQDLPERWSNAYAPLADVSPAIFDSLMDPPTLDEWSSTISFMPNDKAPGPSMISYKMLKHLGPSASALLFNLICACLSDANIPDLWRQATVFPIPKPHEWKCQLKNTRPITLLEVIRKALVKLFYNRLALLLASYHVLQGGNFAGLPGGSCRDPIITLESIIHDSVVTKQPLWILSQDISKAFDSVDLSMLRFALQRLRLPQNAIQFLLSLFMSRSNRVITAHGPTPPYRVRIGIDQDPYRLVSPIASCTVLSDSCSLDVLEINNLVFMDDSTLISSSKEGMEHMLSITEEFYCLNNTSANHNKYVLATNAVAASRDLSPIAFNLSISSLNSTPNIIVTPIPMSSSFRFLGVWFNINGSRNFIRQQLK